MNSININNVVKNYEGFKLDNVSFEIPEGSIVGVVGENGAGKSTTIKAILNMINIEEGSIDIFGCEHTSLSNSLKEDIGVVFDENCFQDNLNILNINEIMKRIYTKWDEEKFKDYQTKMGLPVNKNIGDFSRGMKMKLSIAVALSHNPKLLILDEATSGLDPVVRDEVLNLFLDFVQNEHNSILMSTHISTELEKIADYIVFIHEGKVVFNAVKDDLIYEYGIVKCNNKMFKVMESEDIIKYIKADFEYQVLVKNKHYIKSKYQGYVIDRPTLDEIILMYVKGEEK